MSMVACKIPEISSQWLQSMVERLNKCVCVCDINVHQLASVGLDVIEELLNKYLHTPSPV